MPFPRQSGVLADRGSRTSSPLLACSWFSPLGAHVGAPQRPPGYRLAWGSRLASGCHSNPGPIPAQSRTKACPPPAVSWQNPPRQAAWAGSPHPPSRCPVQVDRASEGTLGAKRATPAKLCPIAQLRAGTRVRGRPRPPGPAPTVQVARGALPHCCCHPHLALCFGGQEFGRVKLQCLRPPCDCLSSASCSLFPKKRQKVALLITLLVRALSYFR